MAGMDLDFDSFALLIVVSDRFYSDGTKNCNKQPVAKSMGYCLGISRCVGLWVDIVIIVVDNSC